LLKYERLATLRTESTASVKTLTNGLELSLKVLKHFKVQKVMKSTLNVHMYKAATEIISQ